MEANRKLAIINGMGEFNRAQGNSSAVKEAVAGSLIAAGAPFRLVQDHSRRGRLEAAAPQLHRWLLSDAFAWCAAIPSNGQSSALSFPAPPCSDPPYPASPGEEAPAI